MIYPKKKKSRELVKQKIFEITNEKTKTARSVPNFPTRVYVGTYSRAYGERRSIRNDGAAYRLIN